MVSTEMLQQQVEGITMVVMTEVAEFVEEDIISHDLGKAHKIEVQIDIILG